MSTRALVLAGYGLNCEIETVEAFRYVGLDAAMRHINDVFEAPEMLQEIQILAVPGGFSFGDDTGSGNALANKLWLRLQEHLEKFVARDTLTIGICNGCQVLTRLGLAPGLDAFNEGKRISVMHNTSGRYQCRWIDLKNTSDSPWLAGITQMHIPVAHGEGNMVMTPETRDFVHQNKLAALRYVKADGTAANGEFPHNPNGSAEDIAAITDLTGRVLAMMPHPERGMFFTQREDWPQLKEIYRRQGKPLPKESDGMAIFRNASRYFQ